MKRFIFSIITITLGMVMVCASFACASGADLPEDNSTQPDKNVPTAILTPSVAVSKTGNPTTTAKPIAEPKEEWITVTATAYCPCEKCCGIWGKDRPDGVVYTASGAVAQEGVTIAADWSVYPKGTVLYIDGLGERIVQDRGGAITGQKIDIYFESHEDALHFGRQELQVRVIAIEERTNYGD